MKVMQLETMHPDHECRVGLGVTLCSCSSRLCASMTACCSSLEPSAMAAAVSHINAEGCVWRLCTLHAALFFRRLFALC